MPPAIDQGSLSVEPNLLANWKVGRSPIYSYVYTLIITHFIMPSFEKLHVMR